MRILSFIYRAVTNFAFLASVYFSLNYIERYNNRATLAILVLVYSGMRAASALRSFYFFQRIERLEVEARRVVTLVTDSGAQSPIKKQTVTDVTMLRRDAEVKSYIDLFFLVAVVVLSVAKIVSE
jgi:DMSO reductase anchor subunit